MIIIGRYNVHEVFVPHKAFDYHMTELYIYIFSSVLYFYQVLLYISIDVVFTLAMNSLLIYSLRFSLYFVQGPQLGMNNFYK